MIYLIFYDISDDKIRTKVAGHLTTHGYERIQYSVFSGIRNPKENSALWKELLSLLTSVPAIRFYVIKTTKNNFKNMEIIGETNWDIDYLLGNKHTLFI